MSFCAFNQKSQRVCLLSTGSTGINIVELSVLWQSLTAVADAIMSNFTLLAGHTSGEGCHKHFELCVSWQVQRFLRHTRWQQSLYFSSHSSLSNSFTVPKPECGLSMSNLNRMSIWHRHVQQFWKRALVWTKYSMNSREFKSWGRKISTLFKASAVRHPLFASYSAESPHDQTGSETHGPLFHLCDVLRLFKRRWGANLDELGFVTKMGFPRLCLEFANDLLMTTFEFCVPRERIPNLANSSTPHLQKDSCW